jgi:hypothetical protein
MPRSRLDSRMVPSLGVQEPHRRFWLSTQRTLVGTVRPANQASDRARARAMRSLSEARLRRRRSSRTSSLATIWSTQRCSSAALKAAGISTTVRPFSR